jgi:ABC-type Fe3+ transport system substrate-binding protein
MEKLNSRLTGMILALVAVICFTAPSWAGSPILSTLSGAEKARVAKLIEGAKKEGKFSWATNLAPVKAAKALEKDFKKFYGLSNVKFRFANRKSGTLIKRFEQEIKADKLSVDVVVLAAASWLHSMRKRGHLMKYTSPEDKYFVPAAKAKMNAPGYWVADGQLNTMAVNRDLAGNVKLTSWHDLTNPKFAGKVLVGDASRSETYTLWYYGLRKVLPRSYFEKLNSQKSGIMIRGSAQRRSLMAGEYWFGTTIMARHNWIAKKAGVKMSPIYPKEGTVALPIGAVIMTKTKHPNMAKLFIDYWRSVRGHHKLLEYNPLNSGRPLPPHKNPDINKFILADDGIAPPLDRVNIIPIDWGKVTHKDVKKWRAEFNSVFSKEYRKN